MEIGEQGIVQEQNVSPVFLDDEQLNIQMQSTTPLDFFNFVLPKTFNY